MIYKLSFESGVIEWCQAKSQLHLLQSYQKEYKGFQEIIDVTEISDEEAKTIMLKNSDYDESDPTDTHEWSLYDSVVGDDFCIVGSTEWV
jgi:prolyl oligopeptidase PreP (S9A serine peptidase family)